MLTNHKTTHFTSSFPLSYSPSSHQLPLLSQQTPHSPFSFPFTLSTTTKHIVATPSIPASTAGAASNPVSCNKRPAGYPATVPANCVFKLAILNIRLTLKRPHSRMITISINAYGTDKKKPIIALATRTPFSDRNCVAKRRRKMATMEQRR